MNEQFNDYEQNPYNNPYYNNQQPKKPLWAAIVSFVLSIVNVVACCCMTYVFAPLSIIFGIVSLAKKWAGKGLAVAGIVISSITLVIAIVSSVLMNTIFKEPYEDIMKFVVNADYYVQEYQKTEEVPDDFKKYCDPKYDSWWDYMGYDSFEDFYDEYMEGFMSNYKRSYGGNYNNDYNDSYDNDYNDSY
ncbi:MAG: DUF4190 domain-containing protein, partial [Ruminococcus sp.]|nr:DUF4190 domain-containing protein [Ruminococcus sp.]